MHQNQGAGSEDVRARRRAWRRALLEAIYDAAGGSVSEFVDALELAAAFDAPPEEGRKLLGYLEEKGWLRIDDHRSGVARLTAAGVDEVEALP